ncbi:MAG: hypothetical protein ACLGGX_09260 [Bdellovibrionia bacterium]
MGAPNLDEKSLVVSEEPLSPAERAGEMLVESTDLGRPDSLRYLVLSHVLEEKYERAIEALNEYVEKPSEYPNYQEKISRYITHANDLVYAIKAKRNFPGMTSLTRSKQQELRERFREHFKELQATLKRIEKINYDLRSQDVRSTVYVVKALWVSAAAIVLLAFFLELTRGLAGTTYVVLDDGLDKITIWIADVLGL